MWEELGGGAGKGCVLFHHNLLCNSASSVPAPMPPGEQVPRDVVTRCGECGAGVAALVFRSGGGDVG